MRMSIEKHTFMFALSGVIALAGLASAEIGIALGGLIFIGVLGAGLAFRLSGRD